MYCLITKCGLSMSPGKVFLKENGIPWNISELIGRSGGGRPECLSCRASM